jgi:hypothetical protein
VVKNLHGSQRVATGIDARALSGNGRLLAH